MAVTENIQTIEQLLVDFQSSYNQRDAQAFLSLFDGNNPYMMLWGTGRDEVRFGLHEIAQQIKRDWEQSDSAELNHYDILAIDAQGDFAVVAADWALTARMGHQQYDYPLLRSTFVLKLVGNRWLIQHTHWSLPSEQKVGRSFPELES